MENKILLAHGSGGKLSQELVEEYVLRQLINPVLARLDDAAVLERQSGRLAFTTDSYVVNPLFFPGGDIGKLAVCGTVNDLSVMGASPLCMSLSLIIEEGFPLAEFKLVLLSIREALEEAGVQVVTGDTKVVDKGGVDKLFINTSGIGILADGLDLSGSGARVGDKIILSGTIGDHGVAIMNQREGLEFETDIQSDCAPLNRLVAEMLVASKEIRCMRDPTRGGVATVLNEIASRSDLGIIIEEDQIPFTSAVGSACELLGFDPLYVANEGKLVAFVAPQDAENVLLTMRKNTYGVHSTIIGEVVAEHPGRVVMKTRLGTSRIINMIAGELLPRIC